ncbi:MAG: DNA adenine methylase [Flavobacteriales bacterium]
MEPYTFTKSNRWPYLSPLRYPGGKAILYPLLKDLAELNLGESRVYAEPYAGGSGAALELLFNGVVEQVMLNDADRHIYAFWRVVLNDTEWLVDRIDRVRVSMTEWRRQRAIYEEHRSHSLKEVAFSTFFLNRCNRGGILPKAGPIGGFEQTGNFLIDARFHKEHLIGRIQAIAEKREQISFENKDASDFICERLGQFRNSRLLMYIDPPYYVQGEGLYLNHYTTEDHADIARLLRSRRHRNWVLSYDNVDPILKLYQGLNTLFFDLQYSLQNVAVAKEVMVFSNSLEVPTAVSNKFLS